MEVFGEVLETLHDAPVAFPPGFVERRHGMDDILYEARAMIT